MVGWLLYLGDGSSRDVRGALGGVAGGPPALGFVGRPGGRRRRGLRVAGRLGARRGVCVRRRLGRGEADELLVVRFVGGFGGGSTQRCC